jgi:hypothetical protein
MGWVETDLAARGTGLLIRRQVLQHKRGPIAFIEIFLKNSTSLGQWSADRSLKRGRGCGQSRNKLLNRVGASSV